jgi:uncharacterized protein (DUF2141 family)
MNMLFALLIVSVAAQSHNAAPADSGKPALVNFAAPVYYATGAPYAASVAVGDLNGDGNPDLVVINECHVVKCVTGTVSVLLGNGDSTFQAAVNYDSGGNAPVSVAIGDLNGDGKLDLAVANVGDSIVSVLMGNGDGTFGAPVSYSSGGGSSFGDHVVAIGDVNGDGKADLVVSNTNSGYVGVLLGNGDGTFQSPVDYIAGGTYTGSVAVADLNGDGKLDIVVNVSCPNSGGCQGNGSSGGVSVLLGNGDGTFRAAVIYPSGGDFPESLAVGDLNGDGIPDLAVSNYDSSTQTALSEFCWVTATALLRQPLTTALAVSVRGPLRLAT